jgi:hypothetical protein
VQRVDRTLVDNPFDGSERDRDPEIQRQVRKTPQLESNRITM